MNALVCCASRSGAVWHLTHELEIITVVITRGGGDGLRGADANASSGAGATGRTRRVALPCCWMQRTAHLEHHAG
ncbi:MAG: hypothetical protein U1F42_05085 [Candidatus Competibacteraceae bacterium]